MTALRPLLPSNDRAVRAHEVGEREGGSEGGRSGGGVKQINGYNDRVD